MLRKLERIIERFAIENLTIYLILLTLLVSLVSRQILPDLGVISLERLMSGEWWNLFFFPFRIGGDPIFLLIYLYIFWMFGTHLETELGTTRYNLYIYLGIFFIVLGGLFFPLQVDGRFLDFSVFVAAAYLIPNMMVYLFFILPIRIKWIALAMVFFEFYSAIQHAMLHSSVLPLLAPVVGLGNFLLYFGPSFFTQVKHESANYKRRKKFHLVSQSAEPVHRCTVCGITELEDPHMDFRYCVECRDHEYCRKHLYNHEHIE